MSYIKKILEERNMLAEQNPLVRRDPAQEMLAPPPEPRTNWLVDKIREARPSIPGAEPIAGTGPTSGAPLEAPRPESNRIMQQIQNIQGKDYSKARYENGVMTKPAGESRDKSWSLKEKLAGAGLGFIEGLLSGRGLVGGALNATKNATDRNFLEKRDDAQQLAKLGQQYEQAAANETFQANTAKKRADAYNTATQGDREMAEQANRIELQKLKDAAEGRQWEPIGHGGLMWKKYKDGREEPLAGRDGTTQEVDLKTKSYQVFDPITKQTVDVTGDQILDYSSPIQTGDANREQQVLTNNANKTFEVQKENINNLIGWQNKIADLTKDAARIAGAGNTAGILSEREIVTRQLTSLAAEPDTDDPKANEAKTKRINDLSDKLTKLNGDLATELGKTEQGKVLADEIRKALPSRPAKLTYTPVKAVKVGSGKPVPKGQDPLGLYQ